MQPQIPFDCAQGRLSTHHPQADENVWGPVRSGGRAVTVDREQFLYWSLLYKSSASATPPQVATRPATRLPPA
jgi:hypothetical protein